MAAWSPILPGHLCPLLSCCKGNEKDIVSLKSKFFIKPCMAQAKLSDYQCIFYSMGVKFYQVYKKPIDDGISYISIFGKKEIRITTHINSCWCFKILTHYVYRKVYKVFLSRQSANSYITVSLGKN